MTSSVIQPPSRELLHRRDDQDGGAQREPDDEQRRLADPARRRLAVGDALARHAEHRQREGQEHVDAVHDHQLADVTAGVEQRHQRRRPHQHDPVLRRQSIRQRREPARHPVVDRHVGQHARAVDEAGLRGDHQQDALGEQRHHRQHPTAGQRRRHGLDQHGVQRLAGHRRDVPQQITDQQAGGGEGQRHRHVQHRPLRGAHARLAHDRQAVRHRLDAGVGAAAQRVGVHEEQEHPAHAQRPHPLVKAGRHLSHGGRERVGARDHAADDHRDVGDHEDHEDRRQRDRRFAHAADVQRRQAEDEEHLERQLEPEPRRRQEAEDHVAGGGDRDGDGEDVVDEQRAARHDAGAASEQLGGDDVPAAAVGEVLDDPAIRGRDHQHGDAGQQREPDRQVGVAAEGLERLLGAVGRRRETVGAQPDPRQERDQRDLVEDPLIVQVARLAKESRLEPTEASSRRELSALSRPRSKSRRRLAAKTHRTRFFGFALDRCTWCRHRSISRRICPAAR